MKHFVALAFFIVSASLTAQVEHAPTVAQCQADQRLWLSQIETDRLKLPDFYKMQQESLEMGACQKVDPSNEQRYYNTSSEISADQVIRLSQFIKRHGLWNKFLEEDKAGMR